MRTAASLAPRPVAPRLVALTACALAACSSPELQAIDRAEPAWGPLAGGTSIELYGTGFDRAVNRVFVGGRESPLVRTIDETHLAVVIPPGTGPGDAELLVVAGTVTLTARDIFHYSAPPAIDAVEPTELALSTLPATIVVHGSGFSDEDAGPPSVLIDGKPIADITVVSDTRLEIAAPAGIAFTRPPLELINQRGRTTARAPRYMPSDNPGLLVFDFYRESFAWFYDLVTGELSSIPLTAPSHPCIYGAIVLENGELWASDACAQGFAFGRVDLAAQKVIDHIPSPDHLYTAIARHDGKLYAYDYDTAQFGTFDPATPNDFTTIGDKFHMPTEGLASDGETMWSLRGTTLSTIDPATDEPLTSIPLTGVVGTYDVTELVWFAGKLYATTTAQRLWAIDPATGATLDRGYIGPSNGMVLLP